MACDPLVIARSGGAPCVSTSYHKFCLPALLLVPRPNFVARLIALPTERDANGAQGYKHVTPPE